MATDGHHEYILQLLAAFPVVDSDIFFSQNFVNLIYKLWGW